MSVFLTELKNYFHKFRTLVFVLFLFFMTATFSFFATSNPHQSSAVSTAGFMAGNIISDAVMANYKSMTVSEIQAFLTNKNPCNNHDYDAYVRQTAQYPTVTWHWTGTPSNGHFVCISEERFGDGTVIGEGQTAAEIIYNAAQENKINPQVLLVLLEKEQSLISDPIPHSGQYRAATGYGCPDTAACDSKYYGFKNQVYRAAELFRYTLDNGYYAYPEKTKGVYVAYNPSASCGRSEVYIENRATAALYRYTPYQPNAAALAAGFGSGDSCSAYGNRNFYLYFTQWFGSTQASVDGEQIIIPDGEYNIISGDFSLTTAGNYNNSDVKLAQPNFASTIQQWRFERDANNAYKITNVSTGRVVDLKSNATDAGTNIQTYASDDSCGQRWKLYRSSNNNLVIESACANGMVIGLGGTTSASASAQLELFDKTASSQTWSLRAGRTLPDGIYTISLNSNHAKSIDISGQFKDGANIQLWTANHTAAQQWHLTYNETNGYYTIENVSSRKVLDVSGSMKNSANIQLWFSNQTCAQRWQIIQTGTGHYAIASACAPGFVIDLSGSTLSNGSNIQLWQYNATAAQQWHITPASTPADGIYTINTKLASQRVADLSGDGSQNGGNIQIWFSNDTPAQEWRLTRDNTTGLYTITNPKTGKAMDASGTLRSGTNVQAWATNSNCAQKWYFVESSENIYTIHTACDTSYVLDVSGTANTGDNIQLWPYNATTAQKWGLTKK